MIYTLLRLLAKREEVAKSPEEAILNTNIQNFLIKHPSFTTNDFVEMLKTEAPNIGRSTVFNLLKDLCEIGTIKRIGRGHFNSSNKMIYNYELSKTAQSISSYIQKQFSLIDFQIWELYQMNEFVNHQLSRNIIFVEVENMLDESIFNYLFDKYSHVLYNADMDEYYKYSGEETIIVRKLISEAPPSIGQYKQASLEKILVDLFGRGISGSVISRSEYRDIFEDSFKKYVINQPKMFRYARRRGIEKNITDFIQDKTDITLYNNQ